MELSKIDQQAEFGPKKVFSISYLHSLLALSVYVIIYRP